ncbi:MAG: hypothetical protein ACRDZM_15325 [Acidimicrobiia bacterium]
MGVLEPGEAGFRPSDVQRVRVTHALDGAGVPPEDLGRLIGEGWFSFEAADVLFPDPIPLISETLEEVSDRLGIPLSLARGG